MESILWQSTHPPTRFFFIPVETKVYAGDFSIQNTQGEQYSVELTNILAFEISSSEANNLTQYRIKKLLEEASSIVQQASESFSPHREDSDSAEEIATKFINGIFSELSTPITQFQEELKAELDDFSQNMTEITSDLKDSLHTEEGREFVRYLATNLIAFADEAPKDSKSPEGVPKEK